MERQCKNCEVLFIKRKKESIVKFNIRKYCSRKCQLEDMHKNNIGNTWNKNRTPCNKGKIMPYEYREKCRERQLGYKPTEEQNESRRQKQKNRPKNHSVNGLESIRQNMIERRKSIIIPFKDTKPERFIESVLSVNNIRYIKHKLFKLSKGYHRVDFYIEPNICIECDGDYFHKLPKQIERDNYVNKEIKLKGFKIIRLWEHDILNNPYKAFFKYI